MLYIIGLGLGPKGITQEGLEALKTCKKIYLENYTVDFPYTIGAVKVLAERKIIPADREKVESCEIVDEAKKLDVALLVYGSPLFATTHMTLVNEAKASGIKCKVIYSASVLDAVAETGLQLYKFGKITSIPGWKTNYEPTSFIETIKDNQKINAHSLILVDIGLDFPDALKQLEIAAKDFNLKIDKLIVCQTLGTKTEKIIYRDIEQMREFTGVLKPYCIIIPGKMHFAEEEVLKNFQ